MSGLAERRTGAASAVLDVADVAARRSLPRFARARRRRQPRLVFFLDEAHLLFDEVSGAYLESITQTVRLIRSKGVGGGRHRNGGGVGAPPPCGGQPRSSLLPFGGCGGFRASGWEWGLGALRAASARRRARNTAYGSWSMAGSSSFLVVLAGSVRDDGRAGAWPVLFSVSSAELRNAGGEGLAARSAVRARAEVRRARVRARERGRGRRGGYAADAPGRWARGCVEEVALDGGVLPGDGGRPPRVGLGVGTRHEEGEQQDEHPQPGVPARAAGDRLRCGGHARSFPAAATPSIPPAARSARSAHAGEPLGGSVMVHAATG